MSSNGAALFAYEASWYISYYDAIGHMLISMNRFTAVIFYQQHENIWKGRSLYFIITIWLILPIFAICWSFDQPFTIIRNANGTTGFLFNDSSIQI
uniref:Serpentine receptor class gamma n=1 Tax=Acrobeloides nanus TaxID=290746 RepID=A0A914C666_9BILA